LQGNGCKKCYQEEQRKSTDEFIRDARSIHGDKYDYSRVVYVGNKHKVEIVCPKHGSFFQQPNSHLSYKSGCLLCSDSKGERAVEEFLKKCNIKHVREYSIPNHRYRYDFYLPDTNTFIEFHGVQHYRPVEYFGGKEAFIKNKKRDLRKKMLVEEIGGKLITIPFTHLDKGTLEKTLAVKLKVVFSRK
jgi:very-short-patch-repair endonuclease